jgi:hypothetical protein
VTALGCLGYAAEKPISFLDPYKDKDKLSGWLSTLDFHEQVAYTGNELMNIGTLLQYARDYHADKQAGEAVSLMIDWLSSNHINAQSGVWGTLDLANTLYRSDAVQAAYHWWPLYFYDRRSVPYVSKALDTIMQTQNETGGFGWGRHNPEMPFNSSACEDIDSIDPLVRMTLLCNHRIDDAKGVLLHAKEHVLSNQMPDGGFVFMKDKDFEYGHRHMYSLAGQGALFPTWFRTLSLALIDTWLCQFEGKPSPYTFVDIPGFQFWRTAH